MKNYYSNALAVLVLTPICFTVAAVVVRIIVMAYALELPYMVKHLRGKPLQMFSPTMKVFPM